MTSPVPNEAYGSFGVGFVESWGIFWASDARKGWRELGELRRDASVDAMAISSSLLIVELGLYELVGADDDEDDDAAGSEDLNGLLGDLAVLRRDSCVFAFWLTIDTASEGANGEVFTTSDAGVSGAGVGDVTDGVASDMASENRSLVMRVSWTKLQDRTGILTW